MIILDEVQHLIDSNRKKLVVQSSDWFKNLIAKTKIPVIFVGLDYSVQIFMENQQLGSRVRNRFQVKPFNHSDKSFRIMLHCFDKALPFSKESRLAESGAWELIYCATKGCLGPIKVLLKEGTKLALESNYDNITLPILSRAFDTKLSCLIGENPFTPGFDIKKALKHID